MRYSFLILLILSAWSSFAQQELFFLQFDQKANLQYWAEHPEEYLSAESITRKQSYNTAITVDDYPVKQAYLDSLTKKGVAPIHVSRWLNGAIVEADSAKIESLSLDFLTGFKRISSNYLLATTRLAKNTDTESQNDVQIPDDVDLHGIEQMHQKGMMGSGVTIAVFDGGFQGVNSWHSGGIVSNQSIYSGTNLVNTTQSVYSKSDHGSKALSVMAAYNDNYRGIAPNASYHLFVTEDVNAEYLGEEYFWLIAAEKADSIGVDIISSSLGYFDFDDKATFGHSWGDLGAQTSVIGKAVRMAFERNILVVVSAGNEGNSAWYYVGFPADEANALAVAAVDKYKHVTAFSSRGWDNTIIKPNVAAMGLSTVVIDQNLNIDYSSGTSFAAPSIAGFAACIWGNDRSLKAGELKSLIEKSGHNYSKPNLSLGYGVPSYDQFLLVSGQKELDKVVFNNPVYSSLSMYFPSYVKDGQEVEITFYNSIGDVVFETNGSVANSQLELPVALNERGVYILEIEGGAINERHQVLVSK